MSNTRVSPPIDAIPDGGIKETARAFVNNLPYNWEIYSQPFLNGERPDCVLLNPFSGIVIVSVLELNEEEVLAAMSTIPKFNIVRETQKGSIDAKAYSSLRIQAREMGLEKQIESTKAMEVLEAAHNEGRLTEKIYLALKDIYDSVPDSNEEVEVIRESIQNLIRLRNVIPSLYCPRLRTASRMSSFASILVFSKCSQDFIEYNFRNFWTMLLRTRQKPPVTLMGFDTLSNRALLSHEFRLILNQNTDDITGDLVRDLRNWLSEPYFSEVDRQPLVMDSKQEQLVSSRTQTGFRRLRGPAGSGKSLVLAARAARLASEGKKVLIVTYNITLMEYLRRLSTRYQKFNLDMDLSQSTTITFLNFHELCKRIVKVLNGEVEYAAIWSKYFEGEGEGEGEGKRKHKEDKERLERVLDYDVPKLVDKLLSEAKIRPEETIFDAILVDEGQDFMPLWWQILRRLVTSYGEMILCADKTQDLYTRSSSWTDMAMRGAGFSGEWINLEYSFRMPEEVRKLAEKFALRFLPDNERLSPIRPEKVLFPDCQIDWVQSDLKEFVRKCAETTMHLVTKTKDERFAITDAVVLVPNQQIGLEIEKIIKSEFKTGVLTTLLSEDEIILTTLLSEDEMKRNTSAYDLERSKKLAFSLQSSLIKITTIHSFKGWESRAVVIAVDSFSSSKDKVALYTALTRVVAHPYGSFLSIVSAAPGLSKEMLITED